MTWEACSVGSCQRHKRCMYLNHPRCAEKKPATMNDTVDRIAPEEPLNHEEARVLAEMRSPHSNLARCYLALLRREERYRTALQDIGVIILDKPSHPI